MPVYYLHKPEADRPLLAKFKTQKASQPLDTLANLIDQAQERNGCISPQEVLDLAAAAKEGVESLFQDIERIDQEAMQEAVFETFLSKEDRFKLLCEQYEEYLDELIADSPHICSKWEAPNIQGP